MFRYYKINDQLAENSSISSGFSESRVLVYLSINLFAQLENNISHSSHCTSCSIHTGNSWKTRELPANFFEELYLQVSIIYPGFFALTSVYNDVTTCSNIGRKTTRRLIKMCIPSILLSSIKTTSHRHLRVEHFTSRRLMFEKHCWKEIDPTLPLTCHACHMRPRLAIIFQTWPCFLYFREVPTDVSVMRSRSFSPVSCTFLIGGERWKRRNKLILRA